MTLEPENPGPLAILGVGHFHPENVIDNAFLEGLDIGTDDAWIVERVGIRSRRTVLPLDYIRSTRNQDVRMADEAALYSNAETGARAAELALTRAGLKPSDIGLVVAGGCAPRWSTPAEACVVAAELEIDAACFNISSACSTLAAQLHFLSQMDARLLPEFVLAVQVENNTRCVDYNDRSTAVLWGDASTAVVLSRRRQGWAQVRATTFHSDPKGWQNVQIERGGHFRQQGKAVQAFAIRKGAETFSELAQRGKGRAEQVYFIGHQANALALDGICRRAKIKPERHLHNVSQFGNCGAAGAPSVLSQNWSSFRPHTEVALVLVGAGLSWGGAMIESVEQE